MTKQSIIQLNHICAAYERKKVLEDINLTVYEKDFLGVIGPNGGGKTTLIKSFWDCYIPFRGIFGFTMKEKKFRKSAWDICHNTVLSTKNFLYLYMMWYCLD